MGFLTLNLLRKMGLEPTRPNGHKILSLARLPVPTLPHIHNASNILLFQEIKVKIFYEKCLWRKIHIKYKQKKPILNKYMI